MFTFSGDKARFTAKGDGTVADAFLGLTWQQGDSGKGYTWAEAKTYCTNLVLAGTGWRLPTVCELKSLVDMSQPVGNKIAAPFQNSNPWFWSATAYQPSPSSGAWLVSFDYGYSNFNGVADNYRVRCVR
ncbi:MAG: DUF1566 domain-containing protein [Candidatus Sericytochromatia bacterium]|nr:DUF1566 domain-containing protein [Candidatus Tanganyikabacteria bacterium]